MDLVVNDKLDDLKTSSILSADFAGCRRVGDCLPEGRPSSSSTSTSCSSSSSPSSSHVLAGEVEADHSRFATPWYHQVQVLLKRDWSSSWRSQFEVSNLILQAGFAGLTAILFAQLPVTQESIFMRVALAFWFCAAHTFFTVSGNLGVFASKEKVAEKELSLNAYSLLSFITATSLGAIPFAFFWCTFFVTIVFWISNLAPTASSFFVTLFALWLHILVIQGLSFSMAAVIPQRFLMVAVMLTITFLLGYGGLFVPVDQMPAWYSWTRYINFVSYTFQIVLSVTLSGAAGSQGFACPSTADASTSPEDVSMCVNGYVSAEAAIEKYGVDMPIWACVTALFGWLVVLRVLAYCLLWVKFVGRHRRAERALVGGGGRGGSDKGVGSGREEQVLADVV